jgi:hypothetical protein
MLQNLWVILGEKKLLDEALCYSLLSQLASCGRLADSCENRAAIAIVNLFSIPETNLVVENMLLYPDSSFM